MTEVIDRKGGRMILDHGAISGMGTNAACRRPSVAELWDSVRAFAAWLERLGYESHDPYDIWGTAYGKWARRRYYAKHPLGIVFTAPLILMEALCPALRVPFVSKQRYATADGQLILAFLNLYSLTGQDRWLQKARRLGEELLTYSVPGYSGYCWGYPFDWQNVNGMAKKDTPFITSTPYCFEAYIKLYDVTRDQRYLEIARSIAAFVFKDLKDTPAGESATASTYSPHDRGGKVVNASAYRAFVLFEAAERFMSEQYREVARANLNFVLKSQSPDGSWLYAIDNPAEAFIDHFHTCFVLKNLCKITQRIKSVKVSRAIEKGYRFYRDALFDAQDMPKCFAVRPRTEVVRLEMYNFAEAITLGVLLRNQIPESEALSRKLAGTLIEEFQLSDGHFVTRIYKGGIRHKQAFLRWPQAQLFYAITNLLLVTDSKADMDGLVT